MWEAESFHPQSRTKIVNKNKPWNDPDIRITIQELWNRYNKYAESLKGNYDLSKQRDSLSRETETIKKKLMEILKFENTMSEKDFTLNNKKTNSPVKNDHQRRCMDDKWAQEKMLINSQ